MANDEQLSRPQLEAIAHLSEQLETVQSQLVRAIAQARIDGFSWAQIGEALNITRQAAAQKYSNVIKEYLEMDFSQEMQQLLEAKSREFIENLQRQDFDAARNMMSFSTAVALTKGKVSTVWGDVIAANGPYQRITRLEIRQGRPEKLNLLISKIEVPGAFAVAEFELKHEKGHTIGQIAFNRNARVIGVVVYLDGDVELPW